MSWSPDSRKIRLAKYMAYTVSPPGLLQHKSKNLYNTKLPMWNVAKPSYLYSFGVYWVIHSTPSACHQDHPKIQKMKIIISRPTCNLQRLKLWTILNAFCMAATPTCPAVLHYMSEPTYKIAVCSQVRTKARAGHAGLTYHFRNLAKQERNRFELWYSQGFKKILSMILPYLQLSCAMENI